MIDVKQAAQTAFDYFSELNSGKFEHLALEEVELTDDEKKWLITLGYNRPAVLLFENGSQRQREYKVLNIDAEKGNVISMKIRKI